MSRKKVQYYNYEERDRIINENKGLFLIEEQNISEGNFLIFSDAQKEEIVIIEVPEEIFGMMKNDNTLLKAQNQALTERADFIEDVVAEMAAQVY